MEKSLSEGTIKQYNTTFRLWWKYCQDNNIPPFDGKTSDVISFFQYILDSTNNIFGSFNSHRAALSLIMSENLGENLLIKRFLKAVFRLRPSKPRYNHTWDPQQVLTYLQDLPDSNLQSLSCKLVTLLALATGQRIQTISLIKCSNMVCSNSKVTILIPELIKSSGPNKTQPSIVLPYFTENHKLCVASCLRKYLNATKTLRKPQCDSLFVTYNKPHGAASKQTLSRWVKCTLGNAGVDTSIFKAHSTRHASTSAALRKGISLDVIRKSAGWSKDSSTFAKFYNRPLEDPNNFLRTVLNS